VLDGIDFHLRVHHPYRPLRGFIQLLRDLKTVPEKVLSDIKSQTTSAIDRCRNSNLLMLATPPQIALGCLIHILREMADDKMIPGDTEGKLWESSKLRTDNITQNEELKGTVERIINKLQQIEAQMDVQDGSQNLEALLKTWRNFHNPINNPDSQT
jgi:hypothetical protein